MRIVVINPNTTASMTDKIGRAARAAASAGTEIMARNPATGPESIEGYFDEAFSVPGLLREIAAVPGADAYVIACFDDTGLEAARCLAEAPVIGIGEAAFHMASLIAHKFGVVTTLPRSISAIENNLLKYGLSSRCARVRAADIPVLALEQEEPAMLARLEAEMRRSIDQDDAEAIVLGCAGMADLRASLASRLGVPVLEGVSCAIRLAEALVGAGLRTSKSRGYATPLPKAYLRG